MRRALLYTILYVLAILALSEWIDGVPGLVLEMPVVGEVLEEWWG